MATDLEAMEAELADLDAQITAKLAEKEEFVAKAAAKREEVRKLLAKRDPLFADVAALQRVRRAQEGVPLTVIGGDS